MTSNGEDNLLENVARLMRYASLPRRPPPRIRINPETYEHYAVARYLQCSVELVRKCIPGGRVYGCRLDFSRRRAAKYKANAGIARHAAALAKVISEMSEEWQSDCRTLTGIDQYNLVELEIWCKRRMGHPPTKRQGGKDLAAFIVAEGVGRLFRRLRKNITFGVSGIDGGPSTEFGRAVEFALRAYQLQAHWRNPTKAAVDQVRSIQGRSHPRRVRLLQAASKN